MRIPACHAAKAGNHQKYRKDNFITSVHGVGGVGQPAGWCL
jgi:hypothetical protein